MNRVASHVLVTNVLAKPGRGHVERLVVYRHDEVTILNPGGTRGRLQPNADELIGHVVDLFKTDNLPVKFAAVCSGLAPDDDHQRLSSFGRFGHALIQRMEPRTFTRRWRIPAARPAPLGHSAGFDQNHKPKNQQPCPAYPHELHFLLGASRSRVSYSSRLPMISDTLRNVQKCCSRVFSRTCNVAAQV